MLDKFLSKLYQKLNEITIPAIQIANDFDEHDEIRYDKYVNISNFNWLIGELKKELFEEQLQEERKRPYKKLMFVEDGSVDIDELEAEIQNRNPEIKLVVYRQNSNKPELLDIKE